MEELERRLRSALTELAEEVPPSHNAWTEHERRLALKSRRARVRPGLMAAVAAAVVALIAVPVMILNLKPSGTDQAAIPTSESSASSGPRSTSPTRPDRYTPVDGEQLLTEPTAVGVVSKGNGTFWDLLVYTVYQDKPKSVMLCSIVLPQGVPIHGIDQAKNGAEPICVPLKSPAKRLLWYQGYLPYGQGVYVYVMSPQVQSVLAWNASSGYAVASPIGVTKDFVVLKATVGQTPPQQYTARDANKATLENG
jgi:hypothetical protein